MFVLDGVIVYSASDLAQAAGCEFAALRTLDAKLKRIELESTQDDMLARTARLGDAPLPYHFAGIALILGGIWLTSGGPRLPGHVLMVGGSLVFLTSGTVEDAPVLTSLSFKPSVERDSRSASWSDRRCAAMGAAVIGSSYNFARLPGVDGPVRAPPGQPGQPALTPRYSEKMPSSTWRSTWWKPAACSALSTLRGAGARRDLGRHLGWRARGRTRQRQAHQKTIHGPDEVQDRRRVQLQRVFFPR